MKTEFRKKINLSDMQFVNSFESKTEANIFADELRKDKKYDCVRVQKAILYSGTKIFYRVYTGIYSYYI